MRPQDGKPKIMHAALQLFVENGYHATSMNQVVREAGVSKGLIYNYFKSKEDLLLAIILQANEDIFAVAEGMVGQKGFQRTLCNFMDGFAESLQEREKYFAFHMSLMFQPDLVAIVREPLQDRANHLLSQATAMFERAEIASPELVARRFVAELDGIALHALSVYRDYPLKAMLEQVTNYYGGLSND